MTEKKPRGRPRKNIAEHNTNPPSNKTMGFDILPVSNNYMAFMGEAPYVDIQSIAKNIQKQIDSIQSILTVYGFVLVLVIAYIIYQITL